MKKWLTTIQIVATLTTFAADDGEIEHLKQMREMLETKTIEEFMVAVHENKWAMPRIPSKWHVETYMKNEDDKKRLFAARDFGYQLALKLDALGKEQVEIRSRNMLYQRTQLLCDLGDWCGEPVGYGNLTLGYECLIHAVAGLNRLTASVEFPLEKCKELFARLNPRWLEKHRLLQVLNDEAGAVIFINENLSRSQLFGKVWADGEWRRKLQDPDYAKSMEESRERLGAPPFTPTLPNAEHVNVEAFMNNLDFFVEAEMKHKPFSDSKITSILNQQIIKPSPFQSWEFRQHKNLLSMSSESEWYRYALSLIKFRSVVGFFPPPWVRSEEDMRRVEKEIEEAAKRGRKIVKAEDSSSYNPLEIAFRNEWNKFADKKAKDYNEFEYSSAAAIYGEIKSTLVFDDDEVKP